MDGKMIKIYVDGNEYQVEAGQTIMQATDKLGFHIPRLCYHPKLSTEASCRMCIVEVEGMRNYPSSCSQPVSEGMNIHTNSQKIRKARKNILELILDNHCEDCNTCERNGNCELQRLSSELGLRERRFQGEKRAYEHDESVFMKREPDKCILCGKCVRVCSEVQKISAIEYTKRGFNTQVAPAFDENIKDSICIACGQCINVCPTAALVEKNMTEQLFEKLSDPSIKKVVQVAPAVRAAVGEPFGIFGEPVQGKMVTALKILGFDFVFDSQFTADLTIMEEASEFIHRLTNKGKLPMITSCSPAWVKCMEHFYPEMIENVSTCRSPMSMLGSLIKTYFAEKIKTPAEKVLSVAVMPCTAKKFEAAREEMFINGKPIVDMVITTRELAWMIKSAGINFSQLEDSDFDAPLGISTGAAALFGVTGGVMEAAIRTAHKMVTGHEMEKLDFQPVRGFEGIKEATVRLDGTEIRVAVANGIGNAHEILEIVSRNPAKYHFIEVMSCPGGCVGGGGQPYCESCGVPYDEALVARRAQVLYGIDHDKKIRSSHENPAIKDLYDNYLGEPLGKMSHKLLHTHYHKRTPAGKVK